MRLKEHATARRPPVSGNRQWASLGPRSESAERVARVEKYDPCILYALNRA
jgi:hypothetical protein